MPNFPEVKKTISSYISEENGRITKHTVLTLGAILTAAALASLKLNEASVVTRYPEDLQAILRTYPKQAVAETLDTAKELLQWIKNQF